MALETDIQKLHPMLRKQLQAVMASLKQANINLQLKEAYRSPAAQRTMFEQGDSQQDAWYSFMQYGLACTFTGGNTEQQAEIKRLSEQHGLRVDANQVYLPNIEVSDLLQGRYPADGDSTWVKNLSTNIIAWPHEPKPPAPSALSASSASGAALSSARGGTISASRAQRDEKSAE